MKKLIAALAASALLMSAAQAQQVPAPQIAARSWLLLDATSGQIIASQDPDTRIEPASLTKVMTAYVVFEALRDKKITLDQMVNVSVRAWKVDGSSSKMFIDPATPVKINDLLYGLMVQSGNDAAVALAEAVAGDEATFVTLMNRDAERMGMKNTRFANPHGLPSPDNYSTARDLSILASRVIKDFPEFYKIDSVKEFTYNRIKQQNRNRLLWLDPTVDGMKTGHTDASGFSMIASAHRPNGPAGERRLISVLSGATSDGNRTAESQKLLNWGFQNFDTVKLYAKGQAERQDRLPERRVGDRAEGRGPEDEAGPGTQGSAGRAAGPEQPRRHAEDERRRQAAAGAAGGGAGRGAGGVDLWPCVGLDAALDEVIPALS
jgi:D-alanyl-D-alanine carboxypeptidase (penicillin-binding protein 5/6)